MASSFGKHETEHGKTRNTLLHVARFYDTHFALWNAQISTCAPEIFYVSSLLIMKGFN